MRTIAAVVAIFFFSAANAQQTMTPQQAAKLDSLLRGWAKSYYPALMAEKQLPEDIVLAFLVDRNYLVLKHTAGFKLKEAASVPAELARLFPGRNVSELVAEHGGTCFRARLGEPGYCVYWAKVDK